MKQAVIFALLFVGASAYVESSEWYGPEYARCSSKSTAKIVSCTAALTKTWDRKLNQAYKALMAQQETDQKKALRDAQRLWIKYRDANCGFYAQSSGSISQVAAAECLRVMTKERAVELEQAIGGQ
jgi:uncharacterized protein YecT (DUF1311 family)